MQIFANGKRHFYPYHDQSDQSAILRISATGWPVTYVWDVAALLTLCTFNFEDMIHVGIVLGDTGLYGLMKDKSNLETKCPLGNLSVSEQEIYSFKQASGQIEAQAEGENVISIDFPGLEVIFKWSVTTKLIEL